MSGAAAAIVAFGAIAYGIASVHSLGPARALFAILLGLALLWGSHGAANAVEHAVPGRQQRAPHAGEAARDRETELRATLTLIVVPAMGMERDLVVDAHEVVGRDGLEECNDARQRVGVGHRPVTLRTSAKYQR